MGKLSDEAKKKIQSIKSDKIKTLLFRFLNKDAEMAEDLFCSDSDQQRFWKVGLLSPFLFKDQISLVKDEAILTLVFFHAPDTLCLELTDILIDLDVETSIPLLQSKDNGVIPPIIAIFEQSPDSLQKKISSWIASLSFAQTERLFGKNPLRNHIIDNHQEGSIWRLQGFHHLEPQTIRDFFYRGDEVKLVSNYEGYTGYGGLVTFFRDHAVSTPIAIELLSLLERLNHEDLYMLFKGKTTSINQYEKNLLYVLFEQYPKSVIKISKTSH